MPKQTIELAHSIGDAVVVDGDRSDHFIVTGVHIYQGAIEYQIAWFSGGDHHTAWIDAFRIKEHK